MGNVASYKKPSVLDTDKKINLIYGLNGTGKSTVSDFLYNRANPCYKSCSVEGLSDEEILVYNQQFVKDYFYAPDSLKGVFTLSKENKESEEKIKSAGAEILKLEIEQQKITAQKDTYNSDYIAIKQNAEEKLWEVKKTYSGGDRVLEFCLDKLMGKKETLFNHVVGLTKPEEKPQKRIDDLKKEAEALQGNTAQKYDLLSNVQVSVQSVESSNIFKKEIIGNNNSTVSELISQLGNSDWVKLGLVFVPKELSEEGEACPFCQKKTITSKLIENINSYFDKTYEDDLAIIQSLYIDYQSALDAIPSKEIYEAHAFIAENKIEFENSYNSVIKILNDNIKRIQDKLKTPSQIVVLSSSDTVIASLNDFITNVNKKILDHNHRLENKTATLKNISMQFWDVVRWEYDQTISQYINCKSDYEKKNDIEVKKLQSVSKSISDQKNIIVEQQKKTVNIEEAIENINVGLIELGIDGFCIEKFQDSLYKIVRKEVCDNTFESLSEGEKMIISFLYFREMCKGLRTAGSHPKKKIIVIDDPMSSLSHVYIFNVGQMIKHEFINSKTFEQVFILTHSLYFFYEMTDTNHDRRRESQKLFRLIKNTDGSSFFEMKYEEIQNDYHSYWSVIKDEKHPPALIANCMRNIIEYFFNFIEKRDLNNVFLKPTLQANKYKAFYRYINRESHSVGQNIFDFKEFNYNDFKEALKLVFEENGYQEHYKMMMK